MTALTEFLLARIAENEDRARLAADEGAAVDVARLPSITFAHVFAWGPQRVLAECEAKRRIVEGHSPWHVCVNVTNGGATDYVGDEDNSGGEPCPTLRLLALPYSDHPDFDQAWRV